MHGYNDKVLTTHKAKMYGRKRGLVFDPLEVFELLRDSYGDIPIPKDAKFEAVAIEKSGAGSFICFYYATFNAGNHEKLIIKPNDANFDPFQHCIAIKPQQLVDIMKYWADGVVPSDAEATAFYINKNFCKLCVEVASDRFPSSDAVQLPMIHLDYDGQKLCVYDNNRNLTEVNIMPVTPLAIN